MIGKLLFSTLALILLINPLVNVLAGPSTHRVHIIITSEGYQDETGRFFGPDYPLRLPAHTPVTLVFEFGEDWTTMAWGNVHNIAVHVDQMTHETGQIYAWRKTGSVSFTTGPAGSRYRGYCILDCIGMINLLNFRIHVVSAEEQL